MVEFKKSFTEEKTMEKEKYEKVREEIKKFGEKVNEIIEQAQTSEEALEKTAKELKELYEKVGAEGLALLITTLSLEYIHPQFLPYYIFKYILVDDMIKLAEKTIKKDASQPYFWENLASAVLQHPLFLEAIEEKRVFGVKNEDEEEDKEGKKILEDLADLSDF
jgi:cell division septum initiation protein DivIVA